MRLTGNQIRYLLAIRQLNQTKHLIKSVDIARELDYSRASVHKMLNCLSDTNYIKKEYYSSVSLTNLGKKAAEKYNEKYKFVKNKLKAIVDKDDNYNIGICELIANMK